MASRVHLIALLIVALIFSAAQCVASCAAEGSSHAVPPCHPHKAPAHETSAACGHDFLVPDAHSSSPAHIAAIWSNVPTVASAPALVAAVAFRVPASSPPNPSPVPSGILRI